LIVNKAQEAYRTEYRVHDMAVFYLVPIKTWLAWIVHIYAYIIAPRRRMLSFPSSPITAGSYLSDIGPQYGVSRPRSRVSH